MTGRFCGLGLGLGRDDGEVVFLRGSRGARGCLLDADSPEEISSSDDELLASVPSTSPLSSW